MLRLGRDVLRDELRFVKARIIALRAPILRGGGPGDERADGADRAVAVVDLERKPEAFRFFLRPLQGLRRVALQYAFGGAVAGHGLSGEVVRRRIAHVLHNRGRYIAKVHETFGQLVRSGRHRRTGKREAGSRRQANRAYIVCHGIAHVREAPPRHAHSARSAGSTRPPIGGRPNPRNSRCARPKRHLAPV